MHEITYELNRKVERAAVLYHPHLPRVATIMVIAITLSAFLYGTFLLETVAQAASRTSAERQIKEISSQLSILEGQYLAATQTLTPTRAKALGFVPPATVSTVIINDKAASFSFVSH